MGKKIVIAVIILLSLFAGMNLIGQISDALKQGEKLSIALETVHQLESQNRELRKKLTEVQSPQFIEEQARNKLNLGKKGETVVIIPEEKLKEVLGASQSAQEERLPNWLGWFRVFFK